VNSPYSFLQGYVSENGMINEARKSSKKFKENILFKTRLCYAEVPKASTLGAFDPELTSMRTLESHFSHHIRLI